MFNVSYTFEPTDPVWAIVNGDTVEAGVVCQVEIDIYNDSNDVKQTKLTYMIQFDGDDGTTRSLPENVFSTLDEALNALNLLLGATPTPSPTATLTQTPTRTPFPTPTPTVTPTASA